jgi:hypothetical protein
VGWREEITDFGKTEANYFCWNWTTQISLKRLTKLVSARAAIFGRGSQLQCRSHVQFELIRPSGAGARALMWISPRKLDSTSD